MAIKSGDIYATELPDGRYGAIRILKTGGKLDFSEGIFHLVAVTKYISDIPPAPTAPSVKEILHENRFFFDDQPCIGIYGGDMPGALKYVGRIEPFDEDQYIIAIGDGSNGRYPLYGPIPNDIGLNVYREWRWENDRENYEAEVARDRESAQKRWANQHRKPKKRMPDDLSWSIIEKLDWDQEDGSKVIE